MKFVRIIHLCEPKNSQPLLFRLKWLLTLFFLGFFTTTNAQTDKRIIRWFEGAEQAYKVRNYDQAIEYAEKILERDSTFNHANLLLADIYHSTKNTEKEIVSLQRAARFSSSPLVYFRLGEAHYLLGNYPKALNAYENYNDLSAGTSARFEEVERRIKSCRFAIEAVKNPVKFQPERLPAEVNSKFDEYWPSLSIDGGNLVITRLMENPGRIPQEDFYISKFDSSGWHRATPLVELNTPENEGAQSLSADGAILFFTACNRAQGLGSCDIYYSFRRNGSWTLPVNAGPPLNTRQWEAQPSFSSDGRTLFFTSNRGGGKGQKDIWKAEITGVDPFGRFEWSEPVNLGDSINTPGDEISPFIHASNQSFYFASNFHTGMGGFDLFLSEIYNDSVFSEPANLGYPVNSLNDEQGLYVSTSGEKAFFASARAETDLDIFSFLLDESIRPVPATYVNARVVDAVTGEPVQALIDLVNLSDKNRESRKELTNDSGEVLLCLPTGSNYAFSVSKEGYLFYSNAFELTEYRRIYDPYNLLIELKPVQAGAEMNLYNIYFETDSFRILPKSEPELQKLVSFLKNNSGLSVEIQGHTDNTGSAERNRELSELRAKSVVDYLIEQGIDSARLNAAGYGATNPIAANETEAGRRLNRRTTIKILKE
jgi:outer membrane protein OmpA-like peptidoglycan-associated protein/Tol biopolymer transport system component